MYTVTNTVPSIHELKIYVLHYTKLQERKTHILNQFSKFNITNFEFIELYDKDEISIEDRNRFTPNYRLSSMSLTLKHFYVYREIAQKHDHALIFEDDIVLCDDFTEKFNLYKTQIPANYDAVFLGDGCNLHIPAIYIEPTLHIYRMCGSKCTDSYLISKSGAQMLCDYIDKHTDQPIRLPIDHWLNPVFTEGRFKVYWVEPTIVTQGSENHTFTSSIN